jgi:hypothetical protein
MNPADVFKANEAAVLRAGLTLVALGAELVAGRIDDALARSDAAARKYPEWTALENAAIAVRAETREEEQMPEIEQAIMRLVWATVKGAIREAVR